jgi:hypothetical protein
MSDSESEDLTDSMSHIHSFVEKLSHDSKSMYTKALKISTLLENPELNLWTEEFHLNERAYKWAKHHLVPRRCSLWQIHRTLLESAKKEKRLARGHTVKLTKEEGEIMDLSFDQHTSVWQVLARLPRFFM